MSVRPRGANPVTRVNDVRRRMWSEAPIPRPAALRRPDRQPVVVPNFRGYSGARASGTSIDVDNFFDMPDFGNSVIPAAGDTALVVAYGYSCSGITAPAGWTTLASGSAGSLDYRVAWRSLTGTDSFVFTAGTTSPAHDSATATGKSRAIGWLFDGGIPTLTLTEHAADTTIAMPTSKFWNAVAYLYDTGESQNFSAGNTTGYAQFPTWHLDERFGLRAIELQVGRLLGGASNVDGSSTPTATDWITCAFGWK